MPEITVVAERSSGTSVVASIRGHQVTVDRPQAKGGSDEGPMGGELFLAGLAGCFMSNLIAAGNARGLDTSGAVCAVIGSLVDSPPRFESVVMEISCDTMSFDDLSRLVIVAERSCIVANTLSRGTSYRASLTVSAATESICEGAHRTVS